MNPLQKLSFEITLAEGNIQLLYGNFQKNVNNTNFPITSNIELAFSADVDLATTLKHGSIKLYRYGYEVGCDFTSSGNKLIIDPKSDLVEGSNYYITGYVYASEYNKTDYISVSFSTTPTTAVVTLDPASKASLSFNSDKSLLTITAPTGAKYILIYKTDQTTGEFYKDGEVSVYSGTATFNTSYDATGTKYYVIAQGVDANNNTVYSAQSDVITK